MRQLNERESPLRCRMRRSERLQRDAGPDRDYARTCSRLSGTRRGHIGARYDAFEDEDAGRANVNAGSGYLEWFPSEFSKLVAAYERVIRRRGLGDESNPSPGDVRPRPAQAASVLITDRRARRGVFMRSNRLFKAVALAVALSRAPWRGGTPTRSSRSSPARPISTTSRRRSAAIVITATHIGEGYQDPHFIEAKPSFVLQLRNADVWAFVGLDLEIGWMPLLLDGARNPKIRRALGLPRRLEGDPGARRPPGTSIAAWATCTRSATRTTGSIRRTAGASRGCSGEVLRARSEERRGLRREHAGVRGQR